MWDATHKAVVDWHDSSWTSVDLRGDKMCESVLQPRAVATTKAMLTLGSSLSWNAQEPTGRANNDDALRKRTLAHMVSVQLLASCFTPPQNLNTLTLPSGWYHKKSQVVDNRLNTSLVSSLRQHTQWKNSPAFGHQARNNSATSLWPDRDNVLSREEFLAERVSLNRRLRQNEDGAAKESIDTKGRGQGEVSGEEPTRRRLLRSRHRRHMKKSEESAASRRVFRKRMGPQGPRGRVEHKHVLKMMRGLRVRNVGDDGHRWSLEPVLRSENHPVFIQPVKDYVMRRWRVFRSRNRDQLPISTCSEGTRIRPDHRRAASSISRDSIRLSRRTLKHDHDARQWDST